MSRGIRYDVLSDGEVIYHDVDASSADYLAECMEKKPYLYKNIEVIEI